jgi:peptidoglycan hydrolase CwlO-like protein
MLETSPDSLIQVLGMVAVAVIAVIVGSQKLLKDWKSSNVESSVINLMHSELERMSTQNTALSLELGRLHKEVIALNKHLQKLTLENQSLQAEVVTLTKEVARFQSVLHKGDLNGSTN